MESYDRYGFRKTHSRSDQVSVWKYRQFVHTVAYARTPGTVIWHTMTATAMKTWKTNAKYADKLILHRWINFAKLTVMRFAFQDFGFKRSKIKVVVEENRLGKSTLGFLTWHLKKKSTMRIVTKLNLRCNYATEMKSSSFGGKRSKFRVTVE